MPGSKQPAVYIMASKRNEFLYVGVTSNLPKRIWQHKEGHFAGWSKIHDTKTLVWYEWHEIMETAIQREKTIKKWPRRWKLNIVESVNPEWVDLYNELFLENP